MIQTTMFGPDETIATPAAAPAPAAPVTCTAVALFDVDRAEFPGEVALVDATLTEVNAECLPAAAPAPAAPTGPARQIALFATPAPAGQGTLVDELGDVDDDARPFVHFRGEPDRHFTGRGTCHLFTLDPAGARIRRGALHMTPAGWNLVDHEGALVGEVAGDYLDAEAALLDATAVLDLYDPADL